MFIPISRGLGPAGALVAGRKVSNWSFRPTPKSAGGGGAGGVYLFAKLSQIVEITLEITNYYHNS